MSPETSHFFDFAARDRQIFLAKLMPGHHGGAKIEAAPANHAACRRIHADNGENSLCAK
jgi:hypothetical protein